MSGLEETFAGEVEFVLLNWDDSALSNIRQQLSITDRSQYVLVDPTGTVVKRWYGILNEATVTSEIEDIINT